MVLLQRVSGSLEDEYREVVDGDHRFGDIELSIQPMHEQAVASQISNERMMIEDIDFNDINRVNLSNQARSIEGTESQNILDTKSKEFQPLSNLEGERPDAASANESLENEFPSAIEFCQNNSKTFRRQTSMRQKMRFIEI